MSFPSTSVLDAFTRADGALGADWTNWNAYSDFAVYSNQARGPADTLVIIADYYDVATYTDLEVYVTIAGLSGDTSASHGVLFRLQAADVRDGFLVEWTEAGTIDIYRIDNGGYTQLGASNTSQTLNAGDKLGAQMVGDVITVYKNEGAGWVQVGTTRTDTTGYDNGYIGIQDYQPSTTRHLDDDFGGGEIVAEAAGQPTMRRWGGIPGMQFTGRRSW